MSSQSTTPGTLTPQDTGNDEVPLHRASSPYKKPQVAFYPHVNSSNKTQKPFSRSAAKRESVMALGSIEHLQHYFTKTGIAAKKESAQQRKGLVPAIGGLQGHIRSNPSLASVDLPPSPSIPVLQPTESVPYVRIIETDPENLRPGVIEDLVVVERMWRISTSSSRSPPVSREGYLAPPGSPPPDTVDVLGVLKSTTRAVRSVRNYLMSLPDEDGDTGAALFRPTILPSGTPKKRLVSRPDDPSNPLTLIRRSALEVLSMLRALEEACRVPLSDDAYDAQSDRGSSTGGQDEPSSRVASPEAVTITRSLSSSNEDHDASVSFSIMQVPGRESSILVWEEEEDEFRNDSDEERAPRERWEERLVLGSGWLYRQDVTFGVIAHEQDIITRYLDAVDNVLFGGTKNGMRGWQREREKIARREQLDRKGRRVSAPTEAASGSDFFAYTRRGRRVVSTGMLDSMQSLVVTEEPEPMDPVHEEEDDETESVDDEDLPEWARRSTFTDDPLSRIHAFLSALLPPTLAVHLPPAGDHEDLLSALSSGQLLCVAYNTAVRRSKKPWGYISKDSIHDIAALEKARSAAEEPESGKKSWTFRRTDNLRLWAAALKIRYLLPIVVPAAPLPPTILPTSESSSSTTSVKLPRNETPIYFDARIVARKEDGWETMLGTALEQWVRVVIDERRGDVR